MAEMFSSAEWRKILDYTEKHGEKFGLPVRRRKSVVLGSFNVRKLGDVSKKSPGAWNLLAFITKRFDLLAIQEVMDNLDGIKHLRSLAGPSCGLVVSDTTGTYPGEGTTSERLAFLFRWRLVCRTEVASDITYDRTKVANTLYEHREDFWDAFEQYGSRIETLAVENADRNRSGKRKKQKPPVPNPHFLTFIRQPLCVSFEIGNKRTRNPYQFLAVNCHLLYGKDPAERGREFQALIAWVVERAKNQERMYYPNLLVMGDCNLEFRKPEVERPKIDDFLKSLNERNLGKKGNAQINFPFLDVHPGEDQVYRSSSRLKDTYDQIAIIFRDRRLPDYKQNRMAGIKSNGYDYGVFNFVELFAHALFGRSYKELGKSAQTRLISRFEHDLTDHLPIWIRLPMPD